jgi:hypothetical protein
VCLWGEETRDCGTARLSSSTLYHVKQQRRVKGKNIQRTHYFLFLPFNEHHDTVLFNRTFHKSSTNIGYLQPVGNCRPPPCVPHRHTLIGKGGVWSFRILVGCYLPKTSHLTHTQCHVDSRKAAFVEATDSLCRSRWRRPLWRAADRRRRGSPPRHWPRPDSQRSRDPRRSLWRLEIWESS